MDASYLSRPPVPDLNGAAEQGRCGLMSHAATCPACLLELSDERDRALRGRLNAWRAGFEAGRQAEAAEMDAAWHAIARPVARGRPYAEMDRKRYPPDGRAGWLLPERDGVFARWLAYITGGER
jgi:hypothetical protein